MGILLGIARASALRTALVEVEEAEVGDSEGIRGDARGRKSGRQVTILFREGWESACRELGVTLPWVTRRANLLVEGIAPPRRVDDCGSETWCWRSPRRPSPVI